MATLVPAGAAARHTPSHTTAARSPPALRRDTSVSTILRRQAQHRRTGSTTPGRSLEIIVTTPSTRTAFWLTSAAIIPAWTDPGGQPAAKRSTSTTGARSLVVTWPARRRTGPASRRTQAPTAGSFMTMEAIPRISVPSSSGEFTTPTGINDLGQVVGYYRDGTNAYRGFIYSNGVY